MPIRNGGYNTAGLGGVGGPYRLDAGHQVHTLPEELKQQIPDHIREKAREMAQRAYKQRLKEIQMSEFDAASYEKFYSKVDKQISKLRTVIENLQAKGKEREWVRHQTSGDVDEGKLVEGLTGEKAVYRRRTERDPEPGTPQQKPKRLRIAADVSGSMYRFNGYDGRLQKTLEACLMVMEALKDYEHKFKYDIVGHSGEEYNWEFTNAEKPPQNQKQRLDTLKNMLAHSQFCISGDHTLEATRDAIKVLSAEEADEHFVIVLSDANLERYGIRPKTLSQIMTSDEKINVFLIFIGSLGDQAERVQKDLPVGKAFICQNTNDIPEILHQIFTSTLLSGS